MVEYFAFFFFFFFFWMKIYEYALTHYAMHTLNIYADAYPTYMLNLNTDVYTTYTLNVYITTFMQHIQWACTLARHRYVYWIFIFSKHIQCSLLRDQPSRQINPSWQETLVGHTMMVSQWRLYSKIWGCNERHLFMVLEHCYLHASLHDQIRYISMPSLGHTDICLNEKLTVCSWCNQVLWSPQMVRKIPPRGGTSDWRWDLQLEVSHPIGGGTSNWRWLMHVGPHRDTHVTCRNQLFFWKKKEIIYCWLYQAITCLPGEM